MIIELPNDLPNDLLIESAVKLIVLSSAPSPLPILQVTWLVSPSDLSLEADRVRVDFCSVPPTASSFIVVSAELVNPFPSISHVTATGVEIKLAIEHVRVWGDSLLTDRSSNVTAETRFDLIRAVAMGVNPC